MLPAQIGEMERIDRRVEVSQNQQRMVAGRVCERGNRPQGATPVI